MNTTLAQTIGNRDWLSKNEETIKKLFPETWTHMENWGQAGMLRVGFTLKLLGADWRSEGELVKVMVYFEKLGLLLRQNGQQIMANPHKVFS